jgi:hypothetical protein
MLKRIIFFISIIFFVACDKEIRLPLDPNASMLVIDGSITDQAGPYFVKITKSIDVSSTQNYPVVENASVIIYDNQGVRDTLSYTKNGQYLTN